MPRRALLVGALLLGFSGSALPAFGEETFVFAGLNRQYTAFVEELAPVQVGAARVVLTSPQHSVTLIRNQTVLHRRRREGTSPASTCG